MVLAVPIGVAWSGEAEEQALARSGPLDHFVPAGIGSVVGPNHLADPPLIPTLIISCEDKPRATVACHCRTPVQGVRPVTEQCPCRTCRRYFNAEHFSLL